jgi:acyl-CoA synthetase (AMP-forming)/AMP-acid ligase II
VTQKTVIPANPVIDRPTDGSYFHGNRSKIGAISSSGEMRTYGEIEDNSNALAAALAARGIEAGDAFAVLLDNRCEYFEIATAARRLGVYYTPTNTHLTLDEVAYIIKQL